MHAVCAGEDPLVDDQTDHDINSVAGVLKLYFRGLENPLFPKERFLDLISTTSKAHSGKSPEKNFGFSLSIDCYNFITYVIFLNCLFQSLTLV